MMFPALNKILSGVALDLHIPKGGFHFVSSLDHAQNIRNMARHNLVFYLAHLHLYHPLLVLLHRRHEPLLELER